MLYVIIYFGLIRHKERDLYMKLHLLILIPLCFVISSTVNAIVPNTEYYQSALVHITQLNEQLSKVEIALKTESTPRWWEMELYRSTAYFVWCSV